jgi:hypothetical protein
MDARVNCYYYHCKLCSNGIQIILYRSWRTTVFSSRRGRISISINYFICKLNCRWACEASLESDGSYVISWICISYCMLNVAHLDSSLTVSIPSIIWVWVMQRIIYWSIVLLLYILFFMVGFPPVHQV